MRMHDFGSTDLRQTQSPANAQRWEPCRGTTALDPRAYSHAAWSESSAPPPHGGAHDSA